MSPLTEPTKLTLAKTYVGIDDPDAADYIAAVEAADEAASPGVGALETATKVAIHSFVKGCKADGIWPAIKASCILAGARTLEGALVPLAGTAPNKFGTAANWNYNRKTGLQGDGSTNYLDSNRNNNADPQDSKHVSAYLTQKGNNSTVIVSAGWHSSPGETALGWANTMYASINEAGWTSIPSIGYSSFTTGLLGASRSSSGGFSVRGGGLNSTVSSVSQSPFNGNINIYSASDGTFFSSARLAFYSIGESLDLALLDTRVSDLITAFGAAIP